jgi:hypothetical protein
MVAQQAAGHDRAGRVATIARRRMEETENR